MLRLTTALTIAVVVLLSAAALPAAAPSGLVTVRNPIDLVAGATAEQFEQALRLALLDDGIDALLAIFVPPLVTRSEDVARAIASAAAARAMP